MKTTHIDEKKKVLVEKREKLIKRYGEAVRAGETIAEGSPDEATEPDDTVSVGRPDSPAGPPPEDFGFKAPF